MMHRWIGLGIILVALMIGVTLVRKPEAFAVTGCPCPAMMQIMQLVADSINDNTSDAVGKATEEIVKNTKEGFAAVTAGQEVALVAAREIADAQERILTERLDDLAKKESVKNHIVFPSACVAGSAGSGLGESGYVQRDYVTQLEGRREDWVTPGALANNEESRAEYIQSVLERKRNPVGGEDMGLLFPDRMSKLINTKEVQDEDAEQTELALNMLLNPNPAQNVTISSNGISSLAYLKLLNERASADLAQSVATRYLSKRAVTSSYKGPVFDENETADGSSEAGIIDREAKRRLLDVEWAVNLERVPEQAVLREIARMLAFQNYMEAEQLEATEQQNLLLAAILRKDAVAGNTQ